MKKLLIIAILFSPRFAHAELRNLIFTPKKGELYGITDFRTINSSSKLSFAGDDYDAKSEGKNFSQYLEYGLNDIFALALRASYGESEEKISSASTYKSKGFDNLDFTLRVAILREDKGNFLSLNIIGSLTPALFEAYEASEDEVGTISSSQSEISHGVELSKTINGIEYYAGPLLTFYTNGSSDDTDYSGFFSLDLNLAANFLIKEDYSIVTGLSFNHTSGRKYESEGVRTTVDPTEGYGLLLAFNYKWTPKMISGLTYAEGRERSYSRRLSSSLYDIDTSDQKVRNISVNLRYLF